MSKRTLESVLCVDDDPDICEVVRSSLNLIGGLIVHTAGSGVRAIDRAHELRPDVILMDVMMPGLDGPSTFKRMRESPLLANIPVIFMTAKVMPAEVAQLLSSGAIGVIGKPFDPLALCDDLFSLWGNANTCEIPRAETGQKQAAKQVSSLADSFLQRAKEEVARLREMLEQAARGEQSNFKEIERLAHSIHGAGAMFGFPEVSVSAGAIERLAEAFAAGNACPDDRPPLQQLLDRTTQLARNIEAAGKTAPRGVGMFQA
jgi:CheY-like chemotaxis protein